MITKLSGGSDDIIYHLTDGKLDSIDAINKKYILFADGTVVSGEYDRGGVWRFESVRKGSGSLTLIPFSGEVVDDEYAADLCELTATDSRLIWSGMRPPKPHPHLVRGARVLTALAAAGLIVNHKEDSALMVACEALAADDLTSPQTPASAP